ncbi:sulfate/molybdate ABC transporter ATP-binding protein [Aeromicrobium fastidiosum]|uniref:ATP-binding cassette domain-containing protein n=1 Tax=Aeromicrobium fastidiosum TaxID=52699 RepID=A0A641AQ21_9ACTN|nr:ATP-binding cassette domain-containing protein [Aeromicrobium fastidiosum]KAA1378192.1 ATP-binding cassette domain-containing protein [Aeromicrobium fastidiosum]MBP2389000.1 molybdate transport system ATP-binding protein [Aeromicrobium fastidiosum]
MSLSLSATVTARDVEVALDVEDGQTVAVLGPNGSGKSTLLSVVAGILRPDAGRATLDGHTLFDVAAGTWLPPHERGTALLAQDPLLFPHLSVLDNVAFGPRSSGTGRAASREVARAWLDEVEAGDLAGRRPAGLSGGQAQRVAIARALAADPRLLLLDEPMAALDVTVVPAMRQVLRRVLAGRSAVIVTHDVLDALLLADHVVVVEAGRIVEQGPTKDVLARPRSTFGAGIAGLNLARGPVENSAVRTSGGLLVAGLHGDRVVPEGTAAVAVFSPGAVSVHRERPGGSPRNVYPAVVRELEPRGSQVRIRTDEIAADVTVPVVAELDLAPGTEVFLAVKASEVAIYEA